MGCTARRTNSDEGLFWKTVSKTVSKEVRYFSIAYYTGHSTCYSESPREHQNFNAVSLPNQVTRRLCFRAM